MNAQKEKVRAAGTQRQTESLSDSSLLIGRDRRSIAVQKSIKPIELPIHTLDDMFWLAGARQIMIFARKHHNLGGYAEMPESTEPLLTLLQRDSKVIIRMQDQGGRLHVLSVLQRRTIPKKVKPLE